ncbi:tRNA methyltransferase 10 homolog B [Phalacrocorax aristotelis]|uniref:tRNA methyltransferase 10 homolog B n=1 Tax=Phalacrocorax aristotelis TaxID=126867 RepID=UPI003F4C59EE
MAGDGADGGGCSSVEPEGDVAVACEALRLLRIEPSAFGPGAGRAGGTARCSRNVLRKRRRWERVLAAKKGKRRQERERSRARWAEGPGAASRDGGRALAALAKERLLEAKVSGPRLCVDLGVANCMTQKETSRLASQIRRLYGANRRAKKPFWLCLTEFVVGSLIYEECFRMNDGFSNYLMDTTQESYLDLFPLDAIVYLTPDSENVLEDIDPNKVYILGGLVDESIHKKLTLQRAQEQSLQTARLPIREYMVKNVNTKNYHSETLAINQVFDVLSTYYDTQSWPAALKAGVSSGKGYVLRDAVK